MKREDCVRIAKTKPLHVREVTGTLRVDGQGHRSLPRLPQQARPVSSEFLTATSLYIDALANHLLIPYIVTIDSRHMEPRNQQAADARLYTLTPKTSTGVPLHSPVALVQ